MLSSMICIKETKVLFLIVEKLAANQTVRPPHRWTNGWHRNNGLVHRPGRAGKCVLIDSDGLMPHIGISTTRSVETQVDLVPGVCFYCHRKKSACFYYWVKKSCILFMMIQSPGIPSSPHFHMPTMGRFHVGRSMSKSWGCQKLYLIKKTSFYKNEKKLWSFEKTII